MNNIQEKLYETNQRITDESELSNRRLIATEQNLLSLINNSNEEIKTKSDESSNKMKKLKRKLRRKQKEHQTKLDEITQNLSKFHDEFDDAKSEQVKINQDVDQDLMKIKEYNAEFKEKIDIIKHKIDTWNAINYILNKLKNKYTLSGLDLEAAPSPISGPIPIPSS